VALKLYFVSQLTRFGALSGQLLPVLANHPTKPDFPATTPAAFTLKFIEFSSFLCGQANFQQKLVNPTKNV